MASGESTTCSGRGASFVCALVFTAALIARGTSLAVKGRVVDGATGQPLEGVHVFNAWWVNPPWASGGCSRLDVTITNGEGRFTLPSWTGNLFNKLVGSEDMNIYYYK